MGLDVFGDSIAAEHYDLKKHMIKHYHYDSARKRLYLFLREIRKNKWLSSSVHLVCYNIAGKKVAFTDKFYGDASYTVVTKKRLIRNEAEKSVVYNLEDGAVLWTNTAYNNWSKREEVIYVNEEHQVLATSSGRLVDLKKCDLITKNIFDDDMGVIFTDVLGKDSLLMINQGLKFLQTKTSDSWQLDMKMGMDKYHNLKSFNYKYKSLQPDDIRLAQRNTLRIIGMHSDLIEDSADLIIAGSNEIVRVARNGECYGDATCLMIQRESLIYT